MKLFRCLAAVLAIASVAQGAHAADAAPADTNAWHLSKWEKGQIVLPAGHYRGSGKSINTERHCSLVVGPGTLIEQVRFETDNNCDWKADGGLFRKLDLGMGCGSKFEARNSIFDDSIFWKAGGWYNAYWSTRWYFENCVIAKRFLPAKCNVIDFSVRATGCTFYDIELPRISYKDDPSGQTQGRDLKFERCRFVNCEITESALATTIDCLFDNCRFNRHDKPDWSKAKKPIVVNAFVVPGLNKPPQSYADGALQVNFDLHPVAQRDRYEDRIEFVIAVRAASRYA